MYNVKNIQSNVFFVDLLAEFLINLILAKIISAVPLAFLDPVAALFSDGKIAHSTFELPLKISLQQQQKRFPGKTCIKI